MECMRTVPPSSIGGKYRSWGLEVKGEVIGVVNNDLRYMSQKHGRRAEIDAAVAEAPGKLPRPQQRKHKGASILRLVSVS